MQVEKQADTLVCTLTGHYDTVRSEELTKVLALDVNAPGAVVFHMGEVTYICSAFLRICVLLAKTVGPANFQVADVTPSIKRVFQTGGVAQFCTFV